MKERKAHILGKNKGTHTPKLCFFVDTETGQERLSPSEGTQKLKLGCAIMWRPKQKEHKEKIEYLTFYEAEDFWKWVNRHIYKEERAYVYAHNWSFDFRTLDGDNSLMNLKYEIEAPVRQQAKWMDIWRGGKKRLDIVDTMNFFPMSLEKVGKKIGLPKLKIDWNNYTMEELERYCKRDVEICYKVIRDLIEWLQREDLGCFRPTTGGLALNIFKHKYKRPDIFIHTNKKAIQLERDSYRGGWTECFYIGNLGENLIYNLDVQSMYPAQMKDNVFPTKFLRYSKNTTVEDLKKIMENFLVIADVNVDVEKSCVGKKGDGEQIPVENFGTCIRGARLAKINGLFFPIGRFNTILTNPELEKVLEYGKINYVRRVAWYNKAKIFREYIRAMSGKRMEAKKQNDEAGSWFYKLIQNSLYGKAGQLAKQSVEVAVAPFREGEFYCSWKPKGADRPKHIYKFGDKAYTEEELGLSFDAFPAIASYVTAYARVRMLNLIEKAGRNNTFYMDTDSLFVNEEGYKNLSSEIEPNVLGKLELKGTDTFEIRGLKDYNFGNKQKIKGVKKDAVPLGNGKYGQWMMEGYKSSLRHGRANEVSYFWLVKQLSREYKKGRVRDDGVVEPWCLSEP